MTMMMTMRMVSAVAAALLLGVLATTVAASAATTPTTTATSTTTPPVAGAVKNETYKVAVSPDGVTAAHDSPEAKRKLLHQIQVLKNYEGVWALKCEMKKRMCNSHTNVTEKAVCVNATADYRGCYKAEDYHKRWQCDTLKHDCHFGPWPNAATSIACMQFSACLGEQHGANARRRVKELEAGCELLSKQVCPDGVDQVACEKKHRSSGICSQYRKARKRYRCNLARYRCHHKDDTDACDTIKKWCAKTLPAPQAKRHKEYKRLLEKTSALKQPCINVLAKCQTSRCQVLGRFRTQCRKFIVSLYKTSCSHLAYRCSTNQKGACNKYQLTCVHQRKRHLQALFETFELEQTANKQHSKACNDNDYAGRHHCEAATEARDHQQCLSNHVRCEYGHERSVCVERSEVCTKYVAALQLARLKKTSETLHKELPSAQAECKMLLEQCSRAKDPSECIIDKQQLRPCRHFMKVQRKTKCVLAQLKAEDTQGEADAEVSKQCDVSLAERDYHKTLHGLRVAQRAARRECKGLHTPCNAMDTKIAEKNCLRRAEESPLCLKYSNARLATHLLYFTRMCRHQNNKRKSHACTSVTRVQLTQKRNDAKRQCLINMAKCHDTACRNYVRQNDACMQFTLLHRQVKCKKLEQACNETQQRCGVYAKYCTKDAANQNALVDQQSGATANATNVA